MTLTAARPSAVGVPPSPMSMVLTLALFEGRKMLTHPVVWVGALASTGLAIFELREQAPVLNRVSMTLAWTMAPLAVAIALVAGWSVLRARGRTDDHPPVIAPVDMGERVGGILAGLLWPALGTLLLQMVLLGWVFTRDPVTSLVWSEFLVGPVYVMFAGALAAALTRWIPHSATPLFTILILGGLQVVVPYNPEQWGTQIGPAALAPIAWPEDIIPYEVAFRPAGLHLGYLVGLVLVVAGLAMLSRGKLGWAALGMGIALAAMLGPAQLGPITETQRVEAMSHLVGDDADLTCETHSRVRYCAMPGYEGWIEQWAEMTMPVIDSAPTSAVDGIEIRQYPVHNSFLLDGQDYNDWWWIQPSYEDLAARDVVPVGSMLASWTHIEIFGSLAARIVGCDVHLGCQGESQRIAMLWLLLHDPESQSNILETVGSDYAEASECIGAELWSNPASADLIVDNWDVLTAPETSYEDAGAILGVSVPTGYDEAGILVGGCP